MGVSFLRIGNYLVGVALTSYNTKGHLWGKSFKHSLVD
uniref:Uncharacterized protein n=1 Tax=Arundo donax TaxID=35708 RepID=A0A0A9T3N8_ARUDO